MSTTKHTQSTTNPHYAAWVAATGGGPNWEYMKWIKKQESIWLTHCINTDSGVPVLRFTDWLCVTHNRRKTNHGDAK